MKRNLLFIVLFFAPFLLCAQTIDSVARGYDVRYESGHLFLQKDSNFNVVDYDFEWPEIMYFNDVVPLKQYISKNLIDYATVSLDSALIYLNEIYGEPVRGTFKTIPDDNRFCYVKLSANILSYKPGRWIAYMLKKTVEPQKLSNFKPSTFNNVVVYDMTKNKVMLANDMLRNGVLQWNMPQDFYNRLFAPLDDDMYDNMMSANISGVWIDGNQIHMVVNAISTYGTEASYTVAMPYEEYNGILTKSVRRMVEDQPKKQQEKFFYLPITWKDDTIYNKVEQMPEFKGGEEALNKYLSFVSRPAIQVSKDERVFVSFVIDKKGNVCDVGVLSSVSPEIDRHAVSVIKGMPAFAPGKHNGKPVCVRMIQPISYKP